MSGSYMPLAVDRWTGAVRCLRLRGIDLSGDGVDAALHVRSRPNLPDGDGEPIRSYGLVTAEEVPTEPGLSFAGMHMADGTPTSFLNLRTFDVSDLPFPTERGDNIELAYDLHVKPPAGVFQRVAWGPFTVRAGVTRPGAFLTEGDDFILTEDGDNIITE